MSGGRRRAPRPPGRSCSLLFGDGRTVAAVWSWGATAVIPSGWSDRRGRSLPPENRSPELHRAGAAPGRCAASPRCSERPTRRMRPRTRAMTEGTRARTQRTGTTPVVPRGGPSPTASASPAHARSDDRSRDGRATRVIGEAKGPPLPIRTVHPGTVGAGGELGHRAVWSWARSSPPLRWRSPGCDCRGEAGHPAAPVARGRMRQASARADNAARHCRPTLRCAGDAGAGGSAPPSPPPCVPEAAPSGLPGGAARRPAWGPAAAQALTSTTTLPCTCPFRIAAPSPGRSASIAGRTIASSFAIGRSRTIRPQARTRSS